MVFPIPPARTVNAILAAIATASVLIMALVPRSATLGVWKGYRVLAVMPEDCEERVASLLDAASIHGYATESNSLLSPEGSLAPYQPQLESMNAERSRWFSDGTARFFYLPSDSLREKSLVESLDGLGLEWSLERHGRMLAYAILSLAFAAASAILSGNRLSVVLASAPFVVYALSSPGLVGFFSSLAALSAVAVYGDILFDSASSLTRTHVIGRIRANPIPMIPAFLSLTIAISDGFHSFALFFLASAASVSLAALSPALRRSLRALPYSRRLHPRFSYLPIRPESLYRTKGPERKTLISVASLFACMLVRGLVSRSAVSPKSWDDSLRRLSIPTPAGYTRTDGFSAESYLRHVKERVRPDAENGLPDLADFFAARWKLEAFAWSPILADTPNPLPGDSFGVNGYSQDSTGRIVSEPNIVGTFDDEFLRDALRNHATPLERMLERQGRFISVTRARQDR